MIVAAIDPGSEQSAWLVWDSEAGKVGTFGIWPNDQLLRDLRDTPSTAELPTVEFVVIEKIESYGMAVGAEVFDTVWWTGRFTEAAAPLPVYRMPRRTVKLALCGSPRAKDSNVRQALLDRFGGRAATGTKAKPGPLYGIHGDLWAALAVAVVYCDGQP